MKTYLMHDIDAEEALREAPVRVKVRAINKFAELRPERRPNKHNKNAGFRADLKAGGFHNKERR